MYRIIVHYINTQSNNHFNRVWAQRQRLGSANDLNRVHKLFFNIPKQYLLKQISPIKKQKIRFQNKEGLYARYKPLYFPLKIRLHITNTRKNLMQLLFCKSATRQLTAFVKKYQTASPENRATFFNQNYCYVVSTFFFFKPQLFSLKKKELFTVNLNSVDSWAIVVPGDFIQLQWSFEKTTLFLKWFKYQKKSVFFWHQLYYISIKHLINNYPTQKMSFKFFWKKPRFFERDSIMQYLMDYRSLTMFALYKKTSHAESNKWVHWKTFSAYNWKYQI